MGIPNDWSTDVIMVRQPRSEKGLTMAQLLSSRITSGLNASSSQAQSVTLSAPATDAAARDLLHAQQASRLVTVNLRDWHFDLNANWVGRMRFDTDADIIVQNAAGTALNKRFTDSQAIQAIGDDLWQNLILGAYRAKLEAYFNDAELRAALTAPAQNVAPAAALIN